MNQSEVDSLAKSLSIYDAIILDIDDTVYDYETAHKVALRHVYDLFQVKLPEITFSEFAKHYRQNRTAVTKIHMGSGASRSRSLAFLRLFESFGLQKCYGLSVRAEDAYWECLISKMVPKAKVVDLVKTLAKDGVFVCALTDMQLRFQVQKIRKLALENVIDFLVCSEEIGCEKPDPRMFDAALAKLKTASEKTLVIGDSWHKDIVGAHNMGMDALWVNGDSLKWSKA